MTFIADILPAASTMAALSTAAAVTSAGLGVAGAQQAANAQRMQARVQQGQSQQQNFAADQETLRGFQQSLALREQLSRVLAAQNARYAGAGLTLEGTPETVADAAKTVAERELALNNANTIIRREQLKTGANLLASQADATGKGADFTSWTGSIGAGINLFDNLDRQAARRAGQTINVNVQQGN
ncbi:MAG: hypothetical protein INF89_08895 [Roseomonas sp.]|nr:hypothetical protein [Roseomonas sp.]